jgi:hypothetical protein
MFKPLCKICGKEKEITFKGESIQYPVYSCPEHSDEDKNEWEIWWTKYHDRYKDKEYWQSLKDRPSCIVGYFCNEFYKCYGYSYKLDYNSPIPYKNREFLVARKLMAMFGEEYMLIPEYIRWVFEKRVKLRKKAVTSFGFFITQDFVNSYFAARAKRNVLKRSSPLPKEFLEWCASEYPDIFERQELATWNDLNGLVNYVKCYGQNNIEYYVVQEAINKGMLSGLEHKSLEG